MCIRDSDNIDLYVFYEKNGDQMEKEFEKDGLPNIEFTAKDPEENTKTSIDIYIIAFKKIFQERLLAEGEMDLFVSNRPIEDEETKRALTGLQYFLYIGIPILIILLILGIILLIIYIIKLKKEQKNETNNANANNNEAIQKPSPQELKPIDRHYPQQANQPQIVYGGPPPMNGNQQIIYVMPESQMQQMGMNNRQTNYDISNHTRNTSPVSYTHLTLPTTPYV